jgi:hypothetical protein
VPGAVSLFGGGAVGAVVGVGVGVGDGAVGRRRASVAPIVPMTCAT